MTGCGVVAEWLQSGCGVVLITCRPKTCLTSREALMICTTLEELQAGCNIITPWLITPFHHHTSIRSHMSHTA